MIKQEIVTRAYIAEPVAKLDADVDYLSNLVKSTSIAGPIKQESFNEFINRVSEEASRLNTISISYLDKNTAIIVYDTRSEKEIANEAVNVQETMDSVIKYLTELGIYKDQNKISDSNKVEYFGSEYDVEVFERIRYESPIEQYLSDDYIVSRIETHAEFTDRVNKFIDFHDVKSVKFIGDKAIIIYRKY